MNSSIHRRSLISRRRLVVRLLSLVSVWCILLASVRTVAPAQQDTTAVDSLLLRMPERQMAPPAQIVPEFPAQPRSATSTNPSISVIGDFQGTYESSTARKFDAYLNETELSFQSVVDPYARADFFISLSRDPATGTYGADLEEAYVTTTDLPMHLQLKAGKFRMALGRANTVHPHALPFIDAPNVLENYLGEEGLNDAGVSLSYLVPNPFDFFQELTLEVTGGPSESPSFSRSDVSRYLYLAHLKNFWDLTENATLEFGLSGLTGPNAWGYSTTMGAVDVTYKWKPLQFNTYQSLVWQSEALVSTMDTDQPEDIVSWGAYTSLTYQLDKRYFLTGRIDYSNLPGDAAAVERGYSATLGWYATEYQKIEIEGKTCTSNFQGEWTQAWLRWSFVIGAHGGHRY